MSQDDNQQTQEQPEEAPAPDGLMASVTLDEEANKEPEAMPHLEGAEQEAADADDEDIIYERPDWFPDKHWDEKDGPDLEGMAKSQKELEQKFHHGEHKPPENGEYDMTALTEAGYEADDPVVSSYREWAQKYGINQAAFSELAETITGIAGEAGVEMQMNVQNEMEALGPQAEAIIKSNVAWADGLLVKGIISEEMREELNIWGGTATGQVLMQKVRAMTGDLARMPVNDVAEAGESKEDFDARVSELMKDPRASDPTWYRANVETLFERRYANGR